MVTSVDKAGGSTVTGRAPGKAVPSFSKVFVQANLPTFTTYALGTGVLLTFSLPGAAIYALYCIASTIAMWGTVCTNCPYYGKMCPCGYSAAATALFKKGNPRLILRRYKLIWVYIAPSWLVPPIAAAPILSWQFSWPLLILVTVFAVMAFAVAPGLSQTLGCCPYWRGCPAILGDSGSHTESEDSL